MKYKIIILSLVSLLLSACGSEDNFDKEYLGNDTSCLVVKGKVVFSYDPLTCQLAVDASRKKYRIFKDDLSSYYNVSLGSLPTEDGQVISGCTVKWTGEDYLYTLSNATFKVEKLRQDGRVWLWDKNDEVVIVLQLL